MQISLDGAWQLYHFPEHESRIKHPDDLKKSGGAPLKAEVPGNVELDLQRAGLLPEPFYAENTRLLRPLETHEWWFVREFELPASGGNGPWELIFEGLDTLATVWVNGEEAGSCANMLVEQRFDVTRLLRKGKTNQVAVRLGSSINYARRFQYDAVSMSWEHREEGLFIRKPPHCWGWDIMPRAVSAGIWRPVRLEQRAAVAIDQLYYWTAKIDRQGAVLGVRYQFHSDLPDPDGYLLQFDGACGDHTFHYEWPVEFLAGGCQIPVPEARLWWPKGHGAPNLYTVTVRLLKDGQILAERRDRIGIRKLIAERTELGGKQSTALPVEDGVFRVDQPPDPQSRFVFYVNGEPVMIKGTNWVPLDAFHSRDRQRLEPAMALVDDLGCNMIRCWGGNVYESDSFFDLCDERGIMVWQDFVFACCRYPQTGTFLEEVRREAEAVTIRLRNHPSLAIWCGDNEIDMVYLSEGLSPEHNRLTREVIPQVLHRCDPQRSYVPSSPYTPPSVATLPEPWQRTPEQHLWGPRGYYKNRFYTDHNAHFIGEIGYHGCPNVSSIQKFISPEKWWPWQDNPEWHAHDVYHLQHPGVDRNRIHLMANQVREVFGEIPSDLETFAVASQITQAEAKKFFIESTRLRKWQTSGLLWWNVLDGWPQFSDAVVDYYFGIKLAYHYIRRSQQPVCLIVGEAAAGKYLPVVGCNDTLQPAALSFRVWDADSGATVLEGKIDLPANQNWQVGRIRTYASDQRLYLLEWETNGEKYGSHYLTGLPPHSLERYRAWLPQIAALPRPFDVEIIAK